MDSFKGRRLTPASLWFNPRRGKHLAPRDDCVTHQLVERLRRAGLGGGGWVKATIRH